MSPLEESALWRLESVPYKKKGQKVSRAQKPSRVLLSLTERGLWYSFDLNTSGFVNSSVCLCYSPRA